MDALNPLRSVHGRGSKTTRAEALKFVVEERTFTKREFSSAVPASRQTADRILVEAVEDGVIARGYELVDPERVRRYIATVHHLLTEHMQNEFSGSFLDCRRQAEEAIVSTGWVDEVPEATPISVDIGSRKAALLVEAL